MVWYATNIFALKQNRPKNDFNYYLEKVVSNLILSYNNGDTGKDEKIFNYKFRSELEPS